MSLITQCPACATMFRVVPDQLRISEGWVRCGHCDEVFDANAHLRTLAEGPTPAAQQAPQQAPIAEQPQQSPQPVADRSLPQPRQGYDWGSVLPAAVQPGDAPPAPPAATNTATDAAMPSDWSVPGSSEVEPSFDLPFAAQDQAPSQQVDPEHDAFMQQNPHHMPPEATAQDVQQVLSATDPPLQEELPAAKGFRLPAPDPDEPVEQVPPSFMTSVGSSASVQAAWVPKAWSALAVLLALLLPLQYLFQNRDRVAGTAPALQPLLATACDWIGCSIGVPRQIESIAIESSSFASVKPGVYVLSVGVKNAAPYALATPALELTLTDRQDQVLLRRVLLPTEWGGQVQIGGSGESSAAVSISTSASVAVDKIAGYKLLVFYP